MNPPSAEDTKARAVRKMRTGETSEWKREEYGRLASIDVIF